MVPHRMGIIFQNGPELQTNSIVSAMVAAIKLFCRFLNRKRKPPPGRQRVVPLSFPTPGPPSGHETAILRFCTSRKASNIPSTSPFPPGLVLYSLYCHITPDILANDVSNYDTPFCCVLQGVDDDDDEVLATARWHF